MKPVIIEFNGLSAIGKSTVAKELEAQLNGRGYSVQHSDQLIQTYNGDRIRKLCRLLKITGLRLPVYLLIFTASFLPFRLSRLQSLSAFWTYMYIYEQEKQRKANDILIVDQGMIQSLAATVHLNELKHQKTLDNILRQMNKLEFTFIIVNADGDSALSFNRIAMRNERRNRFDRMDKSMLKESFDIHQQTFNKIRHQLDHTLSATIIYLDMENSKETNSEMIIQTIENRLD